jgi:Txe/YoeB family toxin of toxin-antitoxin system
MVKKYKLVYTRQAQNDAKRISSSKLKPKVIKLLEILSVNPFQGYPPYEKLMGDLNGTYSRRINILHRFVYQVFEKKRIVKVIRMWTHNE